MSVVAEERRLRDAYAARSWDAYSWASPAYRYMMQERERAVLSLLHDERLLPLAESDVLEIGCGSGAWLRDLVKWGADPARLKGVDLLEERVVRARELCSPGTAIEVASATALPFPDASFDVVLQATVFTSILDRDVRRRVAAEMARVLRPDGVILWYDFHIDNPRNPDVRGVGRSELRALFPGAKIHARRVTLAPPLARAVAPRAWWLASLLSTMPPLRTHTLATIRLP